MKNKLIAKSLLAIAAIGITTTTIASTADASEGYSPREKKPVSINHNIVSTMMVLLNINLDQNLIQHLNILSFRHDYNIVEYNDGTFEYGARPQFNKPAAKTEATIKKEQKLIQAQNLVENLKKHIL